MLKPKSATRRANKPTARDQADQLHSELVRARNAAITAALAVEGKGVFNHVAGTLRHAVILPLDKAIAALYTRAVKS